MNERELHKEYFTEPLTPQRTPHQAIVHFDGKHADFFATVPELME